MNILFLGASKRVELMEHFLRAAKELKKPVQLFSCESKNDFFPISNLATILAGPRFDDPTFESWLDAAIREHSIAVVIPCMDSATVALSHYKEFFSHDSKCWCVVSAFELCKQMEDKILAEKWFRKNGIQVPSTSKSVPVIAKKIRGYGARGQQTFRSQTMLNTFLNEKESSEYIFQELVSGQETTVDAYVGLQGNLVGYVLRDRLEVSDGEVMVCKTRPPTKKEGTLLQSILSKPGWQGCITLQYITTQSGDVFFIEINPRFGGGATCSIHCGLDMPKYVLQEYDGEIIPRASKLKRVHMTRARKDYFYEIESVLH